MIIQYPNDEEMNRRLASFLLSWRTSHQIKQCKIEQDLDLPGSYICKLEKGIQGPDWLKFCKIAAYYEFSMDEFFYDYLLNGCSRAPGCVNTFLEDMPEELCEDIRKLYRNLCNEKRVDRIQRPTPYSSDDSKCDFKA